MENLSKFKILFNKYQKNNSISNDNFIKIIQNELNYDINKNEIDNIIKNKNCINYLEYLDFIDIIDLQISEENELIKAFEVFDKNKTGKIKTEELKFIMNKLGTKLSKEEINNFIKEADPKNEGTFEYKNFSKLIIKMGK